MSEQESSALIETSCETINVDETLVSLESPFRILLFLTGAPPICDSNIVGVARPDLLGKFLMRTVLLYIHQYENQWRKKAKHPMILLQQSRK